MTEPRAAGAPHEVGLEFIPEPPHGLHQTIERPRRLGHGATEVQLHDLDKPLPDALDVVPHHETHLPGLDDGLFPRPFQENAHVPQGFHLGGDDGLGHVPHACATGRMFGTSSSHLPVCSSVTPRRFARNPAHSTTTTSRIEGPTSPLRCNRSTMEISSSFSMSVMALMP